MCDELIYIYIYIYADELISAVSHICDACVSGALRRVRARMMAAQLDAMQLDNEERQLTSALEHQLALLGDQLASESPMGGHWGGISTDITTLLGLYEQWGAPPEQLPNPDQLLAAQQKLEALAQQNDELKSAISEACQQQQETKATIEELTNTTN